MTGTEDLSQLIETDRELARRKLLDLTEETPNSAEAWRLLAASYLRTLEYDQAIAAFKRVIDLEPSDGLALRRLAFATLSTGDNLAAREAYEAAFRATNAINPANYFALIEHRLGHPERAANVFAKLLERAPPDSQERLASGRGLMAALRDLGRLGAADQAARSLLEAYGKKPLHTASWLAERAQSQTYFEWLAIAGKDRLASLITEGLRRQPGVLRFPETYVLPDQRADLEAKAASEAKGALYIIKPNNGSGGQGISVTADLASATERTDVVVQRYVERPYLVGGRKGHLRIYVLITQAQPLRAYVYREGLVRFAPEPYDLRPDRLGEVSMHVTNTAQHEGHPGLVISQDPDRENEGAIWSLSAFMRQVEQDGGDPAALFEDIADLAKGFLKILAADGFFERWAASAPARAYPPKILGLDVLVDADLHPWLLEIQSSPAITGSPLVNRINGTMMRSVFDMTIGVFGTADEADPAPEEIARREAAHEVSQCGLFDRLVF